MAGTLAEENPATGRKERGTAMGVLINIDVPDIARGIAFYTQAFGLTVGRRLGAGAAELLGWEAPVYLLQNAEGSRGAGDSRRTYARHWTPIHLDVVVDDLALALPRVIAAGAILEREAREAAWGRIANLADPFGHGICLIEFLGRGYDEIAGS